MEIDTLIPKVEIPEAKRGNWAVEKFEVPEYSLKNARLMLEGRGCSPGFYTKLFHSERGIIMSDTTAERWDHVEFIKRAKGHCLINGLGIGMCLKAILLKPEVTHVTIVEIDPSVIDLVWDVYSSERCTVVEASAFEYQIPKGVKFGAVWHDIWDSISSENLSEMSMLRSKYASACEWQGCWAEEQCVDLMSEEEMDDDQFWNTF